MTILQININSRLEVVVFIVVVWGFVMWVGVCSSWADGIKGRVEPLVFLRAAAVDAEVLCRNHHRCYLVLLVLLLGVVTVRRPPLPKI